LYRARFSKAVPVNKNKTPEKAREYAFLLLKFRLRSEKELSQRLKRKEFDEQVIKETVSFLRGKGFLDDDYFAKSWVSSRLKANLGSRRIRQELKLKGVTKEAIERELEAAVKEYPENKVVADILIRKFKRKPGEELLKAKRRAYAYLLRRGFSPDVVVEAMNNL
jgi:regulatory protein